MTMSDTLLVFVLTLDATVRLAVPLILAALAGLFSERSGIIDIGLEGKMLAAAFASAAIAAVSGSSWLGLGAGVSISMLLALVHGFACITHRGSQVVSGLAINILAAGLTVTLGIAWFHQGGHTPSLPAAARFSAIDLPGAEALAGVPLLGVLWTELVSGHNVLV
jgi:simple sugar transport system permease protein